MNEKTPFEAIKTRLSKKSKKLKFWFWSMVLDQKWPFFQLYFLGVNPWFWLKNGNFSNFFFRHYTLGNCLLRYSRTKKTPFQAIKTRSSKSRKIEFFSKGDNPWFSSKNGHFSNFFFRHYRPGKCLLPYSRTKKPLFRL